MAKTRGKRAPAEPPLTDAELEARVRAALSQSALKGTDLSKKVGKTDGARAVEVARDLARRNEVHRVVRGNSEFFFAADPVATLDRVAREVIVREGPLDAKGLKAAVKTAAPGHDGLFAEWLKSALARSLLYQQPGKSKALGLEPDLTSLLQKPLAALNKQVAALEAKGISRELIVDFLSDALGLVSRAAPTTTTPQSSSSSREVFLSALRRFAADNPKGALLPVRELRERAGLTKRDFDAAALALSSEGLLTLHHHDHASALSEAEQNALVRDAVGRHYVGVALRGSA